MADGGEGAFARLVDLGAIDAEPMPDGGLAALMPDSVTPEQVSRALGVERVNVSAVSGRDAGSVWVLSVRPVRAGRLLIVPAGTARGGGDLQLVDSDAFGTGLHPTTRLCLEELDEQIATTHPQAMLDVGTGSGILALAALRLGVPRATGLDIDSRALETAAENARVNHLDGRLQLVEGDASAIDGSWPLVAANVLAAPLIEMAPALVRRLGSRGHLLLSGIRSGMQEDVCNAYCRLGMRLIRKSSHGGWVALLLSTSW